MPLLPPWPASVEDGVLRWSAPAPEATLRPRAGGMVYERAGGESFVVAPDLAPRLRWELRLGQGTLLARLDAPVLVPPGQRLELWIAVPLERALGADGLREALDTARPGCRRAVLGPVDTGQVYPSVPAPLLVGPEDPSLEGWTSAALRLRVQNRAEGPLTLRRVPVDETALGLWRRGERVAAGDVLVTLEADHRAEARSTAGEPPAGYAPVDEAAAARPGVPALSWLLETTRRSVEFQP